MVSIKNVPGTVKLINNTGSDNTLACSALVYDEYDVVTLPEKRHDKLVDEMPQSGHWGSLDHCYLTFKIWCPMSIGEQIIRSSHMTFNKISGRYLKFLPEFYVPPVMYTDVKRKDLSTAQDRLLSDEETVAFSIFVEASEQSWNKYEKLLNMGVRKEQARLVLPANVMTQFWMSGRLSDWYHFLNLRTDGHAQYENQYISNLIYEEINTLYPKTTKNWVDYAKGPLPSGCIQTP